MIKRLLSTLIYPYAGFRYDALNYLYVMLRSVFSEEMVEIKSFHDIPGRTISAEISIGDTNCKALFFLNSFPPDFESEEYDIVVSLSRIRAANMQAVKIRSLSNPDGSLRFLLRNEANLRSILAVYSASVPVRWFILCLSTIPFFRNFILKSWHIYVRRGANLVLTTPVWDVCYAGVKGPHQKVVLYESSHIPRYIKLPVGDLARITLGNERAALAAMGQDRSLKRYFPAGGSHLDGLWVAKCDGVRDPSEQLSDCHMTFLNDLNKKRSMSTDMPQYRAALAFFQSDSSKTTTVSSLKELSDALCQTYLHAAEEADFDHYEVARAHCDFTPWNVAVNDGNLLVFDLEMMRDQMPLYFDYFHYVYSVGIHVNHTSGKSIAEDECVNSIMRLNTLSQAECHKYHYLYLFVHSYLYIRDLAQLASEPHIQVSWQLKAWTEAMIFLMNDKEVMSCLKS